MYQYLSKNINSLEYQELIKTPEIYIKGNSSDGRLPHLTYLPIYQLYKHTLVALESNYKGSILKILEYVNDRLNVQDKGIQLFPIKEDVKKSDSIMNSKNLIKSETREIMSNDMTFTTLKPVQVLTPGILTTQKSRNVDISELSLTLLSGLSPYLMEDITLTNDNYKLKILFMLDMQTSSCQTQLQIC